MSPPTQAPAPAGHAHDDHAEAHLPHGSIWPFILAIGISAFGLGILFKDALGGLFPLLMFGVLAIPLIGWFREDHKWWWTNTGTGVHVPRAGTLLFIGSEVFLFGALFSTYFTFKAQAPGAWPDAFHHGEAVHLPLATVAVFTVFLLSSSWTIHVAEKHLKAGNHADFRKWWLITIILGAIFVAGQVYEYYALIVHEGQSIAGDSKFMTAFFMLTGTHGLHVVGGLIALIIMYIRAQKGQFTAGRHAGPESVALYWHFVDLVWIVVMPMMYILPLL